MKKGNIKKKIYILIVLLITQLAFCTNLFGEEKINLKKLREEKNKMINDGKYEEAIQIIEKIIKEYPYSFDAKNGKFEIANIYYIAEQYEKSIEIYKELIREPKINWQRKEALERVVDIYINKLNNPVEAINVCKEFISTYPEEKNIKEVYFLMGKSYLYGNQYDMAINTFKECISKFPEEEIIKRALIEIAEIYYFYKKDYPKAIENYQEIINKYPNTPQAKFAILTIANIYHLSLKDYENATKYYKKILETTKDSSFIKIAEDALVDIYSKTNRIDEAIKIQKEKIAKDKIFNREWGLDMIKLATLYFSGENSQEGIKILKEVIEKLPKTEEAVRAYLYLITEYKKLKEFEKVLDECENFLKTYPSNHWIVPHILLEKGFLLQNDKKYDKAIETFKKIIDEFPTVEFAKIAKIQIKIINDYLKKNKKPSSEELQKMYEEEGLKME